MKLTRLQTALKRLSAGKCVLGLKAVYGLLRRLWEGKPFVVEMTHTVNRTTYKRLRRAVRIAFTRGVGPWKCPRIPRKRGGESTMANKGDCKVVTEDKIKKYLVWLTELDKLNRSLKEKNLLLSQILIDHAERLDNYNRRLVLVEDRVYKSDPCG